MASDRTSFGGHTMVDISKFCHTHATARDVHIAKAYDPVVKYLIYYSSYESGHPLAHACTHTHNSIFMHSRNSVPANYLSWHVKTFHTYWISPNPDMLVWLYEM